VRVEAEDFVGRIPTQVGERGAVGKTQLGVAVSTKDRFRFGPKGRIDAIDDGVSLGLGRMDRVKEGDGDLMASRPEADSTAELGHVRYVAASQSYQSVVVPQLRIPFPHGLSFPKSPQ
jgi:hypothetical protein